jgi:hypothetical protein
MCDLPRIEWVLVGQTDDGVPRWRGEAHGCDYDRVPGAVSHVSVIENGPRCAVTFWRGESATRLHTVWVDGDRRHAAVYVLKTWGAIGELGEQAMLAELAEVVR